MSREGRGRTTIRAVGDIFLDRKDPERAFVNVSEALEAADLLLGNQEGALSDDGEPAKFFPWANFLYSPPEMVEGLDRAGFDVLSLANNQMMNYGPESLMDTIDLLEEHDIDIVGAGSDAAEAASAVSRTVNGLDVGVLAWESTKWDWAGSKASDHHPGLNQISRSPYFPPPHVDQTDLEAMESAIADAAERHDVLLVQFHFGIAGSQQLTTIQTELAHRAVDHGADAVIGAHSHTLQPVESYEGAPIFYSLGNFVFDRPDTWSLDFMASETFLVSLRVSAGGVEEAVVHPAICDAGPRDRPTLLDSDDERYSDVVSELIELSARTDTTLERTEGGVIIPL